MSPRRRTISGWNTIAVAIFHRNEERFERMYSRAEMERTHGTQHPAVLFRAVPDASHPLTLPAPEGMGKLRYSETSAITTAAIAHGGATLIVTN